MNNKNCIALTVMLSCLIFWGTGKGLAQQHTITVTKSGTGSGTVTSSPTGINCGPACSGTFNEGKTVTLKAKADPGSTFKEWGGGCSGTNPTCKVTPNADLTIAATFALPDLYGEWSDISIKQIKSSYNASGKLTVYAGEGKAANVKANVYLSDDTIYDSGDTLLGLVSIGTINAGSSKFKNFKYKLTTDPTGKYLIAVIDPGYVVNESNESNNIEDTCLGDSCGVSKVIGPEGGTIEVTDSGSPLYGVKIEIPPDALSQETAITIKKAINPPALSSGEAGQGTAINIGPSGTIFLVPPTVTIPYQDEAKEEFLAVLFAEEGEDRWTHLGGYKVDTVSNKVVFEVRHLSDYVANPLPKREPNRAYKVHIGVNPYDPTSRSAGKDTIRKVITDGPWKTLGDCIGVAFEETADENEADLIIRWGSPKNPFHVGETIPDYLGVKPTEIVLNTLLKFYYFSGADIPDDSYDLYSLVAHELSHFFGIPDYELGSVTNGVVKPGMEGKRRSLSPFDEEKFKELYAVTFLNETPHGKIKDCRPEISVTIESPCNFHTIDISSIQMKLDGNVVQRIIAQQSPSRVEVSYSPPTDLELKRHFVHVEVLTINGSRKSTDWTFENVESIVIENESPVGTILQKRPTISATVKSLCNNVDFKKYSIKMTLDGALVNHALIGTGLEIQVSYTPNYDLSEGKHTVTVSVFDLKGVLSTEKSWTFVIGEKWQPRFIIDSPIQDQFSCNLLKPGPGCECPPMNTVNLPFDVSYPSFPITREQNNISSSLSVYGPFGDFYITDASCSLNGLINNNTVDFTLEVTGHVTNDILPELFDPLGSITIRYVVKDAVINNNKITGRFESDIKIKTDPANCVDMKVNQIASGTVNIVIK